MKKTYLKLSFVLIAGCLAISVAEAQQNQKTGSVSGTISENADSSLSGVVVDKQGQPLVGATVVVKGSNTGTVTDQFGKFSIQAQKSDRVIVSYIGYNAYEFTVGSRTDFKIELTENENQLDDVIVIGYGTAKRKDFTGSVSSVSMENSALSQLPITNTLEALKGSVPGLDIGTVNSAGGEPSQNIRGQNSISGSNSPLIVLDGIIYMGSIRDINPNDIARVDVLKDATSAATYGSRSANGVIAITTKSGRSEKPTISFNMNVGVQSWLNRPDVMDPDQWESTVIARNRYESDNLSWMSRGELKNREEGKTTNWLDQVTRTGVIQDYQVAASGAIQNGAGNYYLSTAYSNNKGIVVGDDFDRISIMGKIKTNITKWLELNASGAYAQADYSGFAANLGEAYKMSPYGVLYRDEESKLLEKYPYNQSAINPLWGVNDGTRENSDVRDNFRFNSTIVVRAPWIKGLSYRMNLMLNWEKNTQKNFTHETYYVKEGEYDDASRYSQDAYQSLLSKANGNIQITKISSWVMDHIINYNREFGKHSVDATLVATRDSRSSEVVKTTGTDFANNGNTLLGYNGLHKATTQTVDLNNNLRRNIGYVARLNYSYDDRYFLTASYRRDGASVFGKDNKWANFSAVGLGWNITNESFMDDVTFLDYLKIKASWGQNGNQGVDPYATLAVMNNGYSGGSRYEFSDSDKIYYGIYQSLIGNSLLGWESTSSFNVGFESAWLNNRIMLDAEFYYSKTNDQLFTRSIPIMTGFGTMKTSMGKVSNRGFEATLTTRNIVNHDWNWSSTVVFWLNRNRVDSIYGDDLNGDGREDDDLGNNLFIGESLGSIYGYKQIGIVQEEDLEYMELTGAQPGYPMYADLDGVAGITAADRTILGNSKPRFSMSFSNTVSYKNLELYVMFTGIFGGNGYYMASNKGAYICTTGRLRDNGIYIPSWTPENRSNEYPVASFTGDDRFLGLQSKGHVRLQDITLSYKFTQDWFKKIGISNLKVYFSAKNVATWTNWEGGGDPELAAEANKDVKPVPSTFSFGLNLGF